MNAVGEYTEQPPVSRMAVTSMILGMFSIAAYILIPNMTSVPASVYVAVTFGPMLVPGVAAIILGWKSLKMIKRGSFRGEGHALTGIISGSIISGISILMIVYLISLSLMF